MLSSAALLGGVIARPRWADPRAYRGDVDDRAPPTGAHPEQHRLDHRDRAEEIRGEETGDGLDLTLLDGGSIAVPGVVHEHLDPTEALLGLPHGVEDLGVVGHV